jgi:hypothetical protein
LRIHEFILCTCRSARRLTSMIPRRYDCPTTG